MVTAFNIVYSVSALSRILGCVIGQITRFQVWGSIVWACVAGHRPRFFSKKLFQAHFAQWRKAQSAQLEAQPLSQPGFFRVYNSQSASSYLCKVSTYGSMCACPDWANQYEFLGKGCCKHLYAALSYLGFSSLSDYLAAQ
jgi:hypothetical protein